jgi:murein DD-endopeptidase
VHPVTRETHFHNGIDLQAQYQTIYAPEDGVVVYTHDGTRDKISGKYLGIKTADSFVKEFVHLDKILVKKGMPISEGMPIAISGNSGRSTGPHLHFGLKKWSAKEERYVAYDPTRYIADIYLKKRIYLVGGGLILAIVIFFGMQI